MTKKKIPNRFGGNMVNNKMCPVLQVIRQIPIAMSLFGIDILKLYRAFKGLGPFLKGYFEFMKQLKKISNPFLHY